jgi:hypothetical protein
MKSEFKVYENYPLQDRLQQFPYLILYFKLHSVNDAVYRT